MTFFKQSPKVVEEVEGVGEVEEEEEEGLVGSSRVGCPSSDLPGTEMAPVSSVEKPTT